MRLRLVSSLIGCLLAAAVVVTAQQAAPYVLTPGGQVLNALTTGALTVSGTNALSANGIVNAGSYNVADASAIFWNTRTLFRSTANALLQIKNNAETVVAYEINVGTAAPSVTTCGTGAIGAHSNNMGGSFSTTGATTCTLTFGAPAWTFTPFCTFTEKTTAGPYRISAESTTAVTITGFTSGDSFTYHCGGGGI